MPTNFVNPYTGDDDETCSVSFGAQQAYLGGASTGSKQTEAEFNKSKLLGEWGVIKAKLAKGEIPNGTKLLTYENDTGTVKGYFHVKDGKLFRTFFFKGIKNSSEAVPGDAEAFIKGGSLKVAIPQAVASKPKPEPVKLSAADFEAISANFDKYANGDIVAVHPSGDYVVVNKKTMLFDFMIKSEDGYGHVQANSGLSMEDVADPSEGWLKPDGKKTTPAASPKTTPAPPPLSTPQPVAMPTATTPVDPGSDSVGSMSHEDVSAMFVKIKDDLAKEKGLNIKGANAALDVQVYEAIGKVTGYTAAEVKGKIDAYKAAGNKLSALKKKVLAGTKKLPQPKQNTTPVTVAVDPPKPPNVPTPKPQPPAPDIGSYGKKEALAKLKALGESNGYVNGGPQALGLKDAGDDKLGLNQLGDKYATDHGIPKATVKNLAEKYGKDETVDPGTTDVYAGQTWVFAKVVAKYLNNPGDSTVLAVRRNGKLIVIDGHHRAAAAIMTGQKIKMRVLDFTPASEPDPKPHGVPTVATNVVTNAAKKTVADAVDAQPAKVYSDEDVSAAYIIAKDQAVAASNGKFTLYSKSDELDKLIFDAVQAKTGLTKDQAQAKIAGYLGAGKKLSVLKKQLIKQGAMKAEADTLKKSGAAKTAAEKKAEVDAKANAGYSPTPTPATGKPPVDTGKPAPAAVKTRAADLGDISKIPLATKQLLYGSFKAQGYKSYLSSSAGENYQGFLAVVQVQKDKGNDVTLLQAVRIVDEQGALKFGVENTKVFEKKVINWLTTPEGAQYIKDNEAKIAKLAEAAAAAAKTAAEKAEALKKLEEEAKKLAANQPPLPADSAQFQEMSPAKAVEFQRKMLAAKDFGPRERAALRHYTGSAYDEMNKYLRGLSTNISEKSKKALTDASAGMRPSLEPMLLRRGTGFIQLGAGVDANNIWGMAGKTFEDKGFFSTSAAGRAAFGGQVALEVEVPAGTPGMYVAPFSNWPDENEWLLDKGTRFKVLNVRKEGKTFVVRVRVVSK